jgi:hypothetical protein
MKCGFAESEQNFFRATDRHRQFPESGETNRLQTCQKAGYRQISERAILQEVGRWPAIEDESGYLFGFVPETYDRTESPGEISRI